MSDATRADETSMIYHLRYHEKSCANCRYYREHETTAIVSECLLHGRTLGITTAEHRFQLATWARSRLCDLWSRRPKSWVIFSQGTEKNPHWTDPYLPRAINQRRRSRLRRTIRQ